MRVWISAYWVLLVLIVCLGEGCSQKREKPGGQNTPEALIAKSYDALVNGNEQKWMECYFGLRDNEIAGAREAFKFTRAVYQLYRDLSEAYGDDAVAEFRKVKIGENELTFTFGVPPINDPEWPNRAEILIEGEKAKAWVTLNNGKNLPWHMKRIEGVWSMDIDKATGGEPVAWSEQYALWRRAIVNTLGIIGKPNVGIYEVKVRLMKNIRREAEKN